MARVVSATVSQAFRRETEAINEIDPKSTEFRSLELPLARIKKIMKMEEEVRALLGGKKCMVSSEAPIIFAKACELFILELTTRAWGQTEESRRRTLQRSDVAAAVSKDEMFDFLIDIVPRDATPGETAEIAPQQSTQHDRLLWKRRLAQHVFFNQALASRLACADLPLSEAKRPRLDDQAYMHSDSPKLC